MRTLRLFGIVFLLGTLAAAASETLPRSTAEDVRSAIGKADSALEKGDRHLALALYEGSLMPNGVKLAIDEASVDSNDQRVAVYQSLAAWYDELDGDFPVLLVDDVAEADLVLKFVDEIPQHGDDVLGLIQIQKSFKWNSTRHEVKYRGTISIVRTAKGGKLTQAETRDVVMHELGHLLGLADAPQPGSLMGPLERGKPLARPTAAEVEDVLSLRRLLRQRIAQVPTG